MREQAQRLNRDDVGIDCDRKWLNLYVCGGNGGMKPTSADLIATNLDKETLIKYDRDRFLMFWQGNSLTGYSKEPLYGWDNMEGGF